MFSIQVMASVVENRSVDPLLKDLSEKKQSFRRNVESLAAELKEVRSRLASQEHSYARESLNRQVRFFVFGSVLIFIKFMYVYLEVNSDMNEMISTFCFSLEILANVLWVTKSFQNHE